MSGFHTLGAVRPRMTAVGRPPAPVVPIERCRPISQNAPKPVEKCGPAIMLPEHVGAPAERQVVRGPLGLLPAPLVLNNVVTSKVPSLAPIIAVVAQMTEIPVSHIKGRSRKGEVAKARQIAAFVARRFTGRSTSQIGTALGGRDHSTVVYALRRVESVFAGKPKPVDTVEGWVAALWGAKWPKN